MAVVEENSGVKTGAVFGFSLIAVLAVVACLVVVFFGKHLTRTNKFILGWTAFDMTAHIFGDLPYLILYFVYGPHAAFESDNLMALMCRAYGKVDKRILTGDADVVAILLLAVILLVPVEMFLLNAILKDKFYRPIAQTFVACLCIVLGWMYCVPEMLAGSGNFSTDLVTVIVFGVFSVLYMGIPPFMVYEAVQELASGETKEIHTVTKTETKTIRRSQRIQKKQE